MNFRSDEVDTTLILARVPQVPRGVLDTDATLAVHGEYCTYIQQAITDTPDSIVAIQLFNIFASERYCNPAYIKSLNLVLALLIEEKNISISESIYTVYTVAAWRLYENRLVDYEDLTYLFGDVSGLKEQNNYLLDLAARYRNANSNTNRAVNSNPMQSSAEILGGVSNNMRRNMRVDDRHGMGDRMGDLLSSHALTDVPKSRTRQSNDPFSSTAKVGGRSNLFASTQNPPPLKTKVFNNDKPKSVVARYSVSPAIDIDSALSIIKNFDTYEIVSNKEAAKKMYTEYTTSPKSTPIGKLFAKNVKFSQSSEGIQLANSVHVTNYALSGMYGMFHAVTVLRQLLSDPLIVASVSVNEDEFVNDLACDISAICIDNLEINFFALAETDGLLKKRVFKLIDDYATSLINTYMSAVSIDNVKVSNAIMELDDIHRWLRSNLKNDILATAIVDQIKDYSRTIRILDSQLEFDEIEDVASEQQNNVNSITLVANKSLVIVPYTLADLNFHCIGTGPILVVKELAKTLYDQLELLNMNLKIGYNYNLITSDNYSLDITKCDDSNGTIMISKISAI